MLSQCTYQDHPFSSFVYGIHKPYKWSICGSWAWGTAIRVVDVIRICSYSLLVPFRLVSAQYWTFYLMMDSFWACWTLWLGRSNTNQFGMVSCGFMAWGSVSMRTVYWVISNSLLQIYLLQKPVGLCCDSSISSCHNLLSFPFNTNTFKHTICSIKFYVQPA